MPGLPVHLADGDVQVVLGARVELQLERRAARVDGCRRRRELDAGAPQVVVIALLLGWGLPVAALVVAGVLGGQVLAMRRWMRDPRGLAPWYNGVGVTLFVTGMMASSVALAPGAAP